MHNIPQPIKIRIPLFIFYIPTIDTPFPNIVSNSVLNEYKIY